jgi:hypothetical protein
MAVWASPGWLHLLVEGTRSIREMVRKAPLVIYLLGSDGGLELSINGDNCASLPAECAIGRIAELSIPWDGSRGSRLEVRLGQNSLPATATALVLEPFQVDGDIGEEQQGGAANLV